MGKFLVSFAFAATVGSSFFGSFAHAEEKSCVLKGIPLYGIAKVVTVFPGRKSMR